MKVDPKQTYDYEVHENLVRKAYKSFNGKCEHSHWFNYPIFIDEPRYSCTQHIEYPSIVLCLN